VPDGDTVLLADRADRRHRLFHHRMLVLARIAEVLREVTLANDHDADPLDLLEDVGEVVDGSHVLAHHHHQDLAVRIERPDVGTVVVLLLCEPPVARGRAWSVTTDALRLVAFRALRTGIPAGRYGVVRLFHGAHVRPQDAVDPGVQHLLRVPLAALATVRRDADERRDRRRDRPTRRYLAAVQEVLQRVAQVPVVVRVVLHFEHDAVVARSR